MGRADALNARTLQLLEIVDLFDSLYPEGKPCKTSSVWANGGFVSRQTQWWDELEGCFHKHFLMLGQTHLEHLLDDKLNSAGAPVCRNTSVIDIKVGDEGCTTILSNGETLHSRFAIGADGAHSLVRNLFNVPFEVTRPQIIWAVLDGIIYTDFPKTPEIIVFQNATSEVAWVPRERDLDRFYVRMDTNTFTVEQVIAKINLAIQPYTLCFKKIVWFSQFSVKESVAEHFAISDTIYLAGDACHVHSVNGGQGLNTGLADAFNLIWKMNMVLRHGAPQPLLRLYQQERKPVALGVVKTSAELVRATKYSKEGTHAADYLKIVKKRAGYVTGMGIHYGEHELHGKRLSDFIVSSDGGQAGARIYTLLDYRFFTLLVFGNSKVRLDLPSFVRVMHIDEEMSPYRQQIILVRPDAYIAVSSSLSDISPIAAYLNALLPCSPAATASRDISGHNRTASQA
ncbi:putative monooxygenase [Erwinia sp. Ejp617]|nr:putative monooxygenase [Erwinia sp. Ejp617]